MKWEDLENIHITIKFEVMKGNVKVCHFPGRVFKINVWYKKSPEGTFHGNLHNPFLSWDKAYKLTTVDICLMQLFPFQ